MRNVRGVEHLKGDGMPLECNVRRTEGGSLYQLEEDSDDTTQYKGLFSPREHILEANMAYLFKK